jgi:SAM-dependent methyltransferase
MTIRYRGFRQIVLLDYSRTQLEQAKASLGESDRYLYVVGDVYRLPFAPALFDTTTMIRTLHHMSDPLRALRQVRYTMDNGGVFVLEYANKRNLKAIARWALRRQKWNPFDHEPIEFVELNYNFHPLAVGDWLSQAGFEISRVLSVSHFRLGLLKKIIPLGLLVAFDALLQGTGKWFQLTPSVFLSAEAVDEGEVAPEGAFWRCPICGSFEIERTEAGMRCGGCSRVWPFREGIYDFKEPLE